MLYLNTYCPLCSKKVNNTSAGFMEYEKIKYHFLCVKEIGYNKFCLEIKLSKNKCNLI